MVTCPWCGTTYTTFQSNCDRCGGPLPAPAEAAAAPGAPATGFVITAGENGVPTPPPPPRPVSESYAWKLIFTDAWGIVGLVFSILGVVFGFVGLILVVTVVAALVGLPFLLLGLVFLLVGVVSFVTSLQQARQTVAVLRVGQAVTGQITQVGQNYNVRVNGAHPWVVRYTYQVQDRTYQGKVSTLNLLDPTLQPGRAACVLYLPNAPERSSLYPHP